MANQTVSIAAILLGFTLTHTAAAGPINPQVYKTKFDAAKKDAEVVAEVRVLSAVCTETAGEGKAKSITLQLSRSEPE